MPTLLYKENTSGGLGDTNNWSHNGGVTFTSDLWNTSGTPASVNDGVDDRVVHKTENPNSTNDELSVSIWVYLTAYPAGTRTIVAQRENFGGGEQYHQISLTSSGTVFFRAFTTSSDHTQRTTSTTVPLNQWVHIYASIDGTTDLKIWFDKVECSYSTGVVDSGSGFSGRTTGIPMISVAAFSGGGSPSYNVGTYTRPAVWQGFATQGDVDTEYDAEVAAQSSGGGGSSKSTLLLNFS